MPCRSHDTLVRLLLGVDDLQPPVANLLMEKLPEYAIDLEGCVRYSHMMRQTALFGFHLLLVGRLRCIFFNFEFGWLCDEIVLRLVHDHTKGLPVGY
jgi:hypothetical protein